jgi:hypothetical protein
MQMKQVLIAIDQLFNTALGGWADETLSARCWRKRNDDYAWEAACWVIDRLFFWQHQHCRQSYESEQKRRQLPAEYRT